MIQTMTNIKKTDSAQRGMKSNKKVHKDLFKMMKFCAAFCCLLLCTLVNVQAQDFNFRVSEPTSPIVDGSPQGTLHSTGAPPTGVVLTTTDPIRFRVVPPTATVTITSNHFVTVDTSSSVADVTLTGSSTAVSERSFLGNYTIAANNTGKERTGTITFTATTSDTSQMLTLTFTQDANNPYVDGFLVDVNRQSDLDSAAKASIRPTLVFVRDGFLEGIGGVKVSGNGIEDLDSLIILDTLAGDKPHLVIENTNLTSLRGLDSLTYIQGDLVIQNNSRLTSFEGLNNLEFVGGHVIIRENGGLISLEGLDSLHTIGGDVTIQGNNNLTLCCGSDSLARAIVEVRRRDFLTDSIIGRYVSVSDNGSIDCNFPEAITVALGNDCPNIETLRMLPPDIVIDIPDVTIPFDNTDAIDILFHSAIYDVEGAIDATGWEATVDYMPEDADFITLSRTSSNLLDDFFTPRPGIDPPQLIVTLTGGTNETGEDRTAIIIITTTGTVASDPASDTIRITQQAAVPPAGPTLTLTSSAVDTLAHDNGSTISIVFNVSNTTWTAMPSSTGVVTLDQTTGTVIGDTTVTLTATTASANTGLSSRLDTVTIAWNDGEARDTIVTITQEVAPMLTFTNSGDTSVTLAHDTTAANDITFTLGGSASGWSATSNNTSFIMVPAAGMGGTIAVTVVGTSTALRTATITIMTTGRGTPISRTVAITQLAPPTLTNIVDSIMRDHTQAGFPLGFFVGGSATGWTGSVMDIGDGFLTFGRNGPTTMESTSPGNARPDLFVTANTGSSSRTAKVIITTTGSGTPASDTVTITQSAEPHTLTDIVADTVSWDHEGGTAMLIFTVGGSATGWTGAFVGNLSAGLAPLSRERVGLDTMKVTVPPNEASLPRMSDIIITTTGGDGTPASDTATIMQSAAPEDHMLTDITANDSTPDHTMQDITLTFTVDGGATGWKSSVTSAGTPFITLPSTGTTTGREEVIVTANVPENSGAERTDTITITTTGPGTPVSKKVTITQSVEPAPMDHTLSVDNSSFSLGHDEGDPQNIMVTIGNNAISWTASSVSGFVMFTTSSGGNGDNATFALSSNDTGSERTADIVITTVGNVGTAATETVTITQEAAPTLSVDNSSLSVGHDIVDAQNIVVTSGGSATEWNATSASTFVTITTSNGGNGGNATFTLSSNDTGSERTAEIVITTDGSLGSDSAVTVMITQEESPTLSVDNSSLSVGHDVVDAQNIVVTSGGSATEWNATSASTFVTITTSNGGNGGNATFTLSSNDTGSERTAEIVITTDGSLGSDSAVTVMITQEEAPTLSVDNSSLSVGHDVTGEQTIVVTSGGSATEWNATSASTFVTITTSNGGNGGNATFTLSSNDTGSERTAEIVITTDGSLGSDSAVTVMITQEESPTLSVDNSSLSVGHDVVDAQNIVVTSGGSATEWNATSASTFVTITTSNGGNGGNATFTLSSNDTGSERTAEIVITTDGSLGSDSAVTVMITQEESPTLSVDNSSLSVGHDVVDAQNIVVTSGGSATEWNATSVSTFVTITTLNGVSGGNATFTLSSNDTGSERTAEIVITTDGSLGSDSAVTVMITQEEAPTLSVDNSSLSVGHDVVDAQNIVVTSGGSATEWNATSASTFVTITTLNGVSGGNATFTLSSNDTGSERTAEIVITTDGSLGSDSAVTVMITQEEAPTLSVDESSLSIGHDVTGEQTIVVTSGGSATEWNATSVSTFVTITTSNGVSGGSATFTLSSNDTGSERTAEIVITTDGSLGSDSAVTVMITQEEAPTLSVDESSFSLGHDVTGEQTIVVTSGGSATGWNATSVSTFVTITTSSGGNGDNATFTISSNDTGSERTASIVITTDGSLGSDSTVTVMVTQEEAPTIRLSTSAAVNINYDVTDAQTITFDVGGSAKGWKSDIVYSAGTGFITLTTAMNANQTGEVTLMATPDANTGAARTATITFSTTGQLGDSVTAEVIITQGPAPNAPTLGLTSHTSEDTVKIAYNMTTATAIDFMVGGNATGWTSSIVYTPPGTNFIRLDVASNANQTGSVTVTATPTGENTGVERSATITINTSGPGTSPATATLTITQGGAAPILTFIPMDETIAYDAESATDITFNVGGGASGWTSSIAYTPDVSSSGEEFITLIPDNTGAGDITVTVRSTMNTTGVERSAVITITTMGGTGVAGTGMVTLTQEEVPTLSVDNLSFSLGHDVVDAQNIMVTSGGSATGWTASSVSAFVTFTTSDGVSGDNAVFTLMPNTGSERTAEIMITTEGNLGSDSAVTVMVMQEAAPTLSVDPSSLSIGHDVITEQSIMVTSGGSATEWNATSVSTFVTITTLNGGNGDNATFTLSSNDTGSERTAEIVITTDGSLGSDSAVTVMITQEESPTLSVDESSFSLGHDVTGEQTIVVTSGGSATGWNATSVSTFVTITTSSGMSGDNATFTLSSNDTGSERTAEIVITTEGSLGSDSAVTVMITQEEAPTIRLSTSAAVNINYDVTDAQTITFDVGGSAKGWKSDIVYSAGTGFITLTTAMNANQTGEVTLMATPDANTGAARTATITFSTTGQLGDSVTAEVIITQGPAPNAPTLGLTSHTSEDTVKIAYNMTTATAIDFMVGGNATGWTSTIAYTPAGADFIGLDVASNANQTGSVTVTATPAGENTGVERSATITISTSGPGTSPDAVTLTITQGGAPPMLSVSTMAVDTIGHDEVTSDITFTVGGGAMGWTASSDQSFVTLEDTTGDSGTDIDVEATFVDANTTGAARTATITITTVGGTGDAETRMVTLTQEEAPVLTLITPTDTVKLLNGATTVENITFTLEGSATGWTAISSNTNFVTVPSAGTTEREIMVTLVGTSTEFRTSDITITTTGRGMPISRTVTITQEEAPAASPALTLISGSTGTLAHGNGSTSVIEFSVANATWTAASSETFVTLDMSSGSAGDNLMVTATAEANAGVDRMAIITITATDGTITLTKMVTLTQEAAPVTLDPPTLMVSTFEDTTINDEEGSLSISFTLGGSAMGWQSTSAGDDFITLTPEQDARATAGEVTVMATASVNATGSERTQTITFTTVGGVTDMVIITQRAAPPAAAPMVSISTADQTIEASATAAIDVVFTVGGSATGWGSSIVYTPANANFITHNPKRNANEKGDVTITATPTANTGAERVAKIVITPTGGTGTAVSDTITITQSAGTAPPVDPPTLMVSTFEDTTINDEEGSLSISFTLGGTAKGWTSEVKGDEFITLDPAMSASDTNTAVTVMATYEANTGVELTDTIVFTTGDVADTIVITQSAGPPIFTLTSDDAETVAYDAETASDITFKVGGGATGWWAGVIDGDSDNNFVTLSKPSGSAGLDTIKVTTTVNTGEARVDTVVVGTGGEGEATDTIIITQEAIPTISLTDPVDGMIVIDYNAVADTAITFDVGGSATDWTASSDQSFVTLDMTSGASGTGLMATVTENEDVLRVATITIATVGQLGAAKTATVMITQTGDPDAPALEITTPSGNTTVAYTATTTTTTSDSVEIMFTTKNATGWESMIFYGDGVDEFVTLSPMDSAAQTGEVTIKAAVTENAGVERSAKIVFSTTGQIGFSSAKDSLTITQSAGPPIFTLTSDSAETVAYDAETASDITFEVGGGATGWWAGVIDGDSDNNFVTLSKTSGSAGLDTIKVTTTVNTGVARVDTVVVGTGGEGEATDTIIVTQQAGPPTIVVSTDDMTINHDATDTLSITFTLGGSAVGWESTVKGDEFITLDPEEDATATGEVTIKAIPTENTGSERTDTIIFTTGNVSDTVVITQSEVPAPTVSISTADKTIEASATAAIDVVFTVGGSATGWESTVTGDFITHNPKLNANEKGEVTITATPTANSGAERVAKIVITPTGGTGDAVSDTITITQSAGTAPPVDPPTLVIGTSDTTINHDATDTLSITFTLGGSAVGWESTVKGDEFITLDPEEDATATGKVTIKAIPTENTGSERTDTIIFTTGNISDTVVITQSEVPAPMINITTTDKTIEASATAAIDVVFTVGGSATGWRSSIVYTPANANFITHNPKLNANEKGEVTITATPTANSGAERVAKIVITPTGGTGTAVSDTITITQSAGTLGISLDESLTLYPNPTDGVFFIEGLSGALEVHVHDLLGRQVATHSLSAGERKVDVSALSSGMYVVTLKESGGELLTRVLIRQ